MMIFKVLSFVIDILYLLTLLYLITISSIDVRNRNTNDTLFCQESIANANCVIGILLFVWEWFGLLLYSLTHNIKKNGRIRMFWFANILLLQSLNGLLLYISAIQYISFVSNNPDEVYETCYIFQPFILVFSLLTVIEIMYKMIAYYNKREFWHNEDANVNANPA